MKGTTMKINVKDMNQAPVKYLYLCMNIEVLAYTDTPKYYHYWAENEEEALKQLLETLKEVNEVDEFEDYTIDRVWADGIEGGAVVKD